MTLLTVSSEGKVVYAICAYQHPPNRSDLVINGTQNAEGTFWPLAALDVSADLKSWQCIRPAEILTRPDSITFTEAAPRGLLHIDVTSLCAVLAKATWGRIRLENGDNAAFRLDDLLPTAPSSSYSTDFKSEINDLDASRFGSSFALFSVTSIADRLVGQFIMIANVDRHDMALRGAKLRGDFWPNATLQAGRDGNDWKTIYTSRREGALEDARLNSSGHLRPLQVELDAYRSLPPGFTYGKVTFSENAFAIFRLTDLKGQKEE